MLTAAARNAMLGALSLSSISCHSAYPGDTGANEVAGVARQSCSFGAASGGQRVQDAPITFSIPAGVTVSFFGLWSPASLFLGSIPNGGRECRFEIDSNAVVAPDAVVAEGTPIVFTGSTVPTGVTAGTIYYAVNVSAPAFQVSTVPAGSPLLLGTTYSDDCSVSAVAVDTFGSPGSLVPSGLTIRVP